MHICIYDWDYMQTPKSHVTTSHIALHHTTVHKRGASSINIIYICTCGKRTIVTWCAKGKSMARAPEWG